MRFLIIGGTGSLGKKLIERLLPEHEVSIYSRDEFKHLTIKNELAMLSSTAVRTRAKTSLRFFVGDIRDERRVLNVLEIIRPDVIIIAAALKQVDTCELSPFESVQTNLLGTQNVLSAIDHASYVQERGAETVKVLFVSTDKACSPVNSYGMCKALSERLVTSKSHTAHENVEYLCVRYGNVLESRGSIIPLFKYQAMHSDELTVTDPEMTRFLMTLDQSVDLIVRTLDYGHSGQTWIPRLPSMRIGDLASIFAEMHQKKVSIVGLRPGEKMHEDLINESESIRTFERECASKSDYVIESALARPTGRHSFRYSSNDTVLSREQLVKKLIELNVLDASLDSFKGLSIEEIDTSREERQA